MMCTTFWHPDGTPMSAKQFLEMLFGKLPEFFKDESELARHLGARRTPAKKLLQGLAEKDSAMINWLKCSELSMLKIAISSMCWRTLRMHSRR